MKRCGEMTGRGAVLLEVLLALALFIGAGLAILAMTDRGLRSVETARDAVMAAELARSAMAKIEAGIERPETLRGPVRGSAGAGSSLGGPEWELEIDTEPSQFAGLTLVSVRAIKRAGAGSNAELASFTLHQLVRLGAGGLAGAGNAWEGT